MDIRGVSKEYQRSIKGVSKEYQRSIMGVSKEYFRNVLGEIVTINLIHTTQIGVIYFIRKIYVFLLWIFVFDFMVGGLNFSCYDIAGHPCST